MNPRHHVSVRAWVWAVLLTAFGLCLLIASGVLIALATLFKLLTLPIPG